jgi:hypothetical protein
MKPKWQMFRMILTLLPAVVTFAYSASETKGVNCSIPRSLADVVAKAQPGDTIRINGTCYETVTITTDRITLDGQGSGVLDGGGAKPGSFAGVIVIDGARGVGIRGLTLQHGSNGVVSKGGASFDLSESVLQNNAVSGIQIEAGSSAELTNVTLDHNGSGMNVLGASAVILKGTVVSNDNSGNGMFIGGASLLELRGAAVQTNHNGLNGIVIDGAHAIVFGFPESQGSSLVANNNGNAGIGIPNGILEDAGSGPNMFSAAHNGSFGIFLPLGGTIDSPFNASRFFVSDNPIGAYFGLGSKAIIHGGVTIQNNKVTGLLADAAGTINVNAAPVPIPPNASNITGNGTDVDLRFGSSSIFGSALVIGTIKCDKTVLSRGSIVCP